MTEEDQGDDADRVGVEAGEAGDGDRDAHVAGPPLVLAGQPEGVQPVPAEGEVARAMPIATAAPPAAAGGPPVDGPISST